MSYPFSIKRKVLINSGSLTVKTLMTEFLFELDHQVGTLTELKEKRIKILVTKEFSMNTSSLANFNYGEISFKDVYGDIEIQGKIMLIEHAIFFGLIIVVSAYFGIFHFSNLQINFGLPILLLLVDFVAAYLFPKMSFNTFFDLTIKKCYEKHT